VTTTFSALTTITKSPVSTCGANAGFVLPRSVAATTAASRPSVLPSASTTHHLRGTSFGLGV
jgi:hypothetical protein